MIWKWDLHFIWNSICTILKPPCFNMEKIKRFWWAWWCYLEKERLNPQRNQKDVAHVVILIESHLYFINRKRSASAVFTSLIVTGKRKVGSQTSCWPKSKSTCWSHEWLVTQVQQHRWSQQPSSALTSPAPLSPVGSQAIRIGYPENCASGGIHFRVLLGWGTHLKVTTL